MTIQKSLARCLIMLAGVFALPVDSLSFFPLKNTRSTSYKENEWTTTATSTTNMIMIMSGAADAESTRNTRLLPTEYVSNRVMSSAKEAKPTSKQQQKQTLVRNGKDREVDETRNYIFGYGSLICDQSRSLSNPTLRVAGTLPVTIHNVEREWSARTKNGWTAVGVSFENGKKCNGVLIEVTADELVDLDLREASYNRHALCLDHVEQVSFLNQQEFYSDPHPVFDAKRERDEDDDRVKVWIYMQRNAVFADSSHPIPQSYVDIILRGCLKISKDFAKSFIETTHGWDHHQHHNHHHDGDDDGNAHRSYFVDDRHVPIYPKADVEFSNDHGNMCIIDQLLEECIPHVMKDRVEYDPLQHLEALSDALEQDKANPRAVKHIAKVIRAAAAAKCKANTTCREQATAFRLADDGHPLVA